METTLRQRLVFAAMALAIPGLLGLSALVLAVGLNLSKPAPRIVGAPPPELAEAEAVTFQSASGETLKGWWLKGDQVCTGTLVLLHGVWESRLGMVRRAAHLHAEGYNVLLFDFQAHGESSGAHITYGKKEGLDAIAAVALAKQRAPGQPVAVIGQSLGGAAAVLAEKNLGADLLILESVYGDIDSALGNRLRIGLGEGLGPLATPILVPVFKLLLPPFIGVSADELRPVDHMANIGARRLMVMSGTRDERTPIAEARALFDAARLKNKSFWGVEGAAHQDLERYAPNAYWARVDAFLSEPMPCTLR